MSKPPDPLFADAAMSLAPPTPGVAVHTAAWLIENAGVKKGYSIPGSKAGISTKHTLAITNRGGATAAEVVGLATYVQAMVQSHFGIILYPEPNLIGVEI